MTPILLVSINCLFGALIYIVLVAIVAVLILWVIGKIAPDFPPLITKLVMVLAVVICVYILVMCLAGAPVSHPALTP